MHQHYFKFASVALLTVGLVFSGCLSGGSKAPATRYYVLNSLRHSDIQSQSLTDLKEAIIVVGPVSLTQMLDRPQIIIRQSDHEIRVSDLDRWAEPLQENFSRVLVDNISILLSHDRVVKYPLAKAIPVAYQVVIDVTRFDGDPQNEVVLKAKWAILGDGEEKVLFNKQSSLNEPTKGNSVTQMVMAQSRLVAKLSHEIAEEIKRLQE